MSASKEEDASNVLVDGLLNAASTKVWKPINGAPSKEAMEEALCRRLNVKFDDPRGFDIALSDAMDAFAAQRVAEEREEREAVEGDNLAAGCCPNPMCSEQFEVKHAMECLYGAFAAQRVAEAVAAEREACAVACLDLIRHYGAFACEALANAIRARSKP